MHDADRATRPVKRILIAGMGNVLCADDAFGVAVANALLSRSRPPGVDVIEVGIGGMHIVQALLDGYEALIVLDAVDRGAEPGALFVLDPARARQEERDAALADTHLAVPSRVLVLAQGLGVLPERVLIVGCQGASFELGLGMSALVEAAVERAVAQVEEIIGTLVEDGAAGADAFGKSAEVAS